MEHKNQPLSRCQQRRVRRLPRAAETGFTTEYTLWCSSCAAWSQHSAQGQTKLQLAAWMIRREGWTYAGAWLCPKCSANAQALAQPGRNKTPKP